MGTHPGWAAHAELGPLGVLQLADDAFDFAEHLDATYLSGVKVIFFLCHRFLSSNLEC